jgi:hypothetical protein
MVIRLLRLASPLHAEGVLGEHRVPRAFQLCLDVGDGRDTSPGSINAFMYSSLAIWWGCTGRRDAPPAIMQSFRAILDRPRVRTLRRQNGMGQYFEHCHIRSI